MTDHDLQRAVRGALGLDPSIDAGRIVVAARNGVVTLTGEVDAHTQKSTARCKAEGVPGVKKVADELEVCAAAKSRQPADDVASSVLNALHWDLAVPSDRLSVKCEKGWVTLTGEVDRPYQKSSAEADVRRIRGVVGVTNAIRVGAGGVGQPEAPARGDAILPTESIAAIAEDREMTAGRRARLA